MDDLRRTDLPLTRDAADEIDRLRALNEKLLMALKHARALMPIPDQFVDEVIIEAEGSEK